MITRKAFLLGGVGMFFALLAVSATLAQEDGGGADSKADKSAGDKGETPVGHYTELPWTWGGPNKTRSIKLCAQANEGKDIARMNTGAQVNCWEGTKSLLEDSSNQVPASSASKVSFIYPSSGPSASMSAKPYLVSSKGWDPTNPKNWGKNGLNKYGGIDVKAYEKLAVDTIDDELDSDFFKQLAQQALDRYNSRNESTKSDSAKPTNEYYSQSIDNPFTLDQSTEEGVDKIKSDKKDAELTLLEGTLIMHIGILASGIVEIKSMNGSFNRHIDDKLWAMKAAQRAGSKLVMCNPWLSFVFAAAEGGEGEKKKEEDPEDNKGGFTVTGAPSLVLFNLKEKSKKGESSDSGKSTSYNQDRDVYVVLCSNGEAGGESGGGKVKVTERSLSGHGQYDLFDSDDPGAPLRDGKPLCCGGRQWEDRIKSKDLNPGITYARTAQYPTRNLAQAKKWLQQQGLAKAVAMHIQEQFKNAQIIKVSHRRDDFQP